MGRWVIKTLNWSVTDQPCFSITFCHLALQWVIFRKFQIYWMHECSSSSVSSKQVFISVLLFLCWLVWSIRKAVCLSFWFHSPLSQFIHHKGRGLFIILLYNLIKFHKNLSGLSFSAPLRHKSTQNDIMLSQRHSLATNKGKMEQRNKELACTRSNQG